MINLPIVMQTNQFSCGECVVKSVLAYYGISSKINFSSELDGASPRTIEHQLRIRSLNVIAGNFSFDLLLYFIDNNIPVISCFDGHWIVFCNKKNRSILYMDPEYTEYQIISKKKLKKIWYDHDTVGTKYEFWGIAAFR